MGAQGFGVRGPGLRNFVSAFPARRGVALAARGSLSAAGTLSVALAVIGSLPIALTVSGRSSLAVTAGLAVFLSSALRRIGLI